MIHKSGNRVELKYCERCGGLWVRDASCGSIFCNPCEHIEITMPVKRAALREKLVRRQPCEKVPTPVNCYQLSMGRMQFPEMRGRA